MPFDPSKLTPGRWNAGQPVPELCYCPGDFDKACWNIWADDGGDVTNPCGGLTKDDAEGIAAMQNAFDIQMARGWGVVKSGPVWSVVEGVHGTPLLINGRNPCGRNPVEAILNAEAFMLDVEATASLTPSASPG